MACRSLFGAALSEDLFFSYVPIRVRCDHAPFVSFTSDVWQVPHSFCSRGLRDAVGAGGHRLLLPPFPPTPPCKVPGWGQAALLGVGKEKLGMAGIGLLCCRGWVCLTREGSRHCW